MSSAHYLRGTRNARHNPPGSSAENTPLIVLDDHSPRTESKDPAASFLEEHGFDLGFLQPVVRMEQRPPVHDGGFSDIYMGHIKDTNDDRLFAVKVIRGLRFEQKLEKREKLIKTFLRELEHGLNLKHRFVLPFTGVCSWPDISKYPCFVMEWMPNGNARDFLPKNLDVNIVNFLSQVCEGVSFLHTKEIIHGDIKGKNILVNRLKEPLLADFGLSKHLIDGVGVTSSSNAAGSLRWMAPELLLPEEDAKIQFTKETDMWALGITILEIWGNAIPFKELSTDFLIYKAISTKQRPHFPTCYNRDYASLDSRIQLRCEQCYSWEKTKRLNIIDLITFFSTISQGTEQDGLLSLMSGLQLQEDVVTANQKYSRVRASSRTLLDLYIRNETKDLNIEYEDSHEGRHDVLETWTFVAMLSGREIARLSGKPGEKKKVVLEQAAKLALSNLKQDGTLPPYSPKAEDSFFKNIFQQWLDINHIRVELSQEEEGPRHAPDWTFEIRWNGVVYGSGKGPTVDTAELEAMKSAACQPDWKNGGCPQHPHVHSSPARISEH